MNILISGGCKNNKTVFAEDLAVKLSEGGKRFYVATMIPYDDEDRARIERHIKERAGKGFGTIETGRDIVSCLEKAGDGATLLIDSVTALLLNEMFPDSHLGEADPDAEKRCRDGLLLVAEKAKNAIFITDYIYSDTGHYDAFTDNYRKSLAYLDRSLAFVCDAVIEMCAGNVIIYKGGLPA